MWKCGIVRQSKDIVSLSPSHEPFVTLYFHTSQRSGSVEWCDKLGILSHFSPSHEPFVILYLVLHFPEVWKCGIVRQSKDIVSLSPSHEPFVTLYFHTSQRSGSVEWCDKLGILPHFSPSHEPFVILYFVPHFSEVWKCGKVRQSKDIVALFPLLRTPCHSLLSSTLLGGVEVWNSPTS